ncbi:hypothetical protein MMC07_007467 [Pseudocyphellaria aurata]|nr:hypothetical protein [Pseudocyphellaria aurata]
MAEKVFLRAKPWVLGKAIRKAKASDGSESAKQGLRSLDAEQPLHATQIRLLELLLLQCCNGVANTLLDKGARQARTANATVKLDRTVIDKSWLAALDCGEVEDESRKKHQG